MLGNGERILFWKDKWIGDFKLCDRFPRLFRFERDKNVLVMNHGDWSVELEVELGLGLGGGS